MVSTKPSFRDVCISAFALCQVLCCTSWLSCSFAGITQSTQKLYSCACNMRQRSASARASASCCSSSARLVASANPRPLLGAVIAHMSLPGAGLRKKSVGDTAGATPAASLHVLAKPDSATMALAREGRVSAVDLSNNFNLSHYPSMQACNPLACPTGSWGRSRCGHFCL